MNQKEIWKPIKGYEGYYEISNRGRVKSLERDIWNGHNYYKSKEIIMKPAPNSDGYPQIPLCMNGKSTSIAIHRLVAIAFIPNPNNLPMVNHKDGDKTNNLPYNLEWCTNRDNIIHGFRILGRRPSHLGKFGYDNHLSKEVIQLDLNGNEINRFGSTREVERETGFQHSNISACCIGKRHTSYGYRWKYAD